MIHRLPEAMRAPTLAIAKSFFDQGATKVYVAHTDKRVYVGVEPAKMFADREGTPENIELTPADCA